jgi:hypothetical protein
MLLRHGSLGTYLGERASTFYSVSPPPQIVWTWSPILCSLHNPIEGVSFLAGSITFPPVLLVKGHLVVETVVHGDIRPSLFVNSVHVLVEDGTVALAVVLTVGNEEIGVNHFVEERLHEIFSWP